MSDRSLFFKIEQPFGVKKDLGMMLHECDWACGDHHHVFDGATLESEDTL